MRSVYVLILLWCGMMSAHAGHVTESDARKKAEAFVRSGPSTRGAQTLKRVYLPLVSKSAPWSVSDAPVYAYNCEGGGYVVVSGDDRTQDVLGYSSKGRIDADRLSPNLRSWLQGYVNRIESIPVGFKTSGTRAVSNGSRSNVEPLLKTAWGQGYPFNLHTPELHIVWGKRDTTIHAATGCVATAMSQVMTYYRYPSKTLQACPAMSGVAEIPVAGKGEETDTVSVNWQSDSIPAGTKIDWENIVDEYDISKKSNKYHNTDAQREAVARLMQYAGASVNMEYGWESGASTDSMLIGMADVFGYKDAYNLYNDDYTLQQWNDHMYDEVTQNGPVLFGAVASDESYAHQFILDGYELKDGKDYFHFNFGWDGEDDGFYLLDALIPESEFMGDGVGFSSAQIATTGFGPKGKGKVLIDKVLFCDAFSIGEEGKTYTRPNRWDPFPVNDYYMACYNTHFRTLKCNVGIAIYSSSNKQVRLLYFFENREYCDLFSGLSVYPERKSDYLYFGEILGDGTYYIKFVCQNEDSDEWVPMERAEDYVVTMTIKGNDATFSNSTPPTAISTVEKEQQAKRNPGWYTPSGMRLNGKPTAKGLYIHEGRKVYVQ